MRSIGHLGCGAAAKDEAIVGVVEHDALARRDPPLRLCPRDPDEPIGDSDRRLLRWPVRGALDADLTSHRAAGPCHVLDAHGLDEQVALVADDDG